MSSEDQTTSASNAPEKKRGHRYQRYNSPRITVMVTTQRIIDSIKRDSWHCMIAEAIKEAHPQFVGVMADLATVRFSDPARQVRYTYLTPRPAQEALIYFDQGVTPEPFEVLLARAAIITRSGNWGRVRKGAVAARASKGAIISTSKGDVTGASKGTVIATSKGAVPPLLGSARLQSEGGNGIHTVVGGRPPPIGPLVGSLMKDAGGAYYAPGNIARRRKFGLRILRY